MIDKTFVDWFAGIGGFRLGMERAGFKCVANYGGCEIDKFCRYIYRRNFNNNGRVEEIFRDAREVNAAEVPDHTVFCAGFPCQSFSIAGRRRGFDDIRGTVFFEICRVLMLKRPSYLFLENVPGILNCPAIDAENQSPIGDGWVFSQIMETLGELGMMLNGKCLTAPAATSLSPVNACTLSEILEPNPDQRYSLSKAMQKRWREETKRQLGQK